MEWTLISGKKKNLNLLMDRNTCIKKDLGREKFGVADYVNDVCDEVPI